MLIPGPLVAALLGIPASTLRRWNHHGHVRRRGTGHAGVALYDLSEVRAYARSLGRATITSTLVPRDERTTP